MSVVQNSDYTVHVKFLECGKVLSKQTMTINGRVPCQLWLDFEMMINKDFPQIRCHVEIEEIGNDV